MINNSADRISKYNDYNRAVSLACETFEEICPVEKQPYWLKYSLAMKVGRNINDNWVIKLFLRPKAALQPHVHWEWFDNGVPMQIHVDPATGKSSVVLCGGPPPKDEIFFEVEVDTARDLAKVLVYTDLNMLDGSMYEINKGYDKDSAE